MRTVFIRAGIAVAGILALTAAGYRNGAEENTDRIIADKVDKADAAELYIVGPYAGAAAYMAGLLSDTGALVADSGASVSGNGKYEAAKPSEDELEILAEQQNEEEKRQVEEAKIRCLTNYFGYVPTDEELDLFYRTVQAECGNTEPEDGIGAVADVIANRCRSDIFPDTLTGVITQKNQFTTWSNGAIAEAKIQPWVYEICDDHISEGAVYDDIYYFTAGYYNPYCEPAFVIGHHYFGR